MVVRSIDLIRTVEAGNTLGEGVLWNLHTQSAWWTDIEGKRLYEYSPGREKLQSWNTPYRVASFGFVDGEDRLVVAFDRGIALYSVHTGRIDWLVEPGALPQGIRFNDGKVDPQGRFWVGTMVEDRSVPSGSGALYCYTAAIGLVEHVSNVTISNGLCWNPDSTVMYHADSPGRSIRAYRFDANTGRLMESRLFAQTERHAFPDGSTVDADGGVWNAQWAAGQVVRYTAEGSPDLVVPVPARQPSCVAFGGPGLNFLFVTSARLGLTADELAADPGAGDLFIYRTDFRGLPSSRFKRQ